MSLNDSKEQILKSMTGKDKKIKDLKNEIVKSQKNQSELEERIYTVSIENKQK